MLEGPGVQSDCQSPTLRTSKVHLFTGWMQCKLIHRWSMPKRPAGIDRRVPKLSDQGRDFCIFFLLANTTSLSCVRSRRSSSFVLNRQVEALDARANCIEFGWSCCALLAKIITP